MDVMSAFETRIRAAVDYQIHGRTRRPPGPRRDVELITRILAATFLNGRLTVPELIKFLPDINENRIEDNLLFLKRFPPDKPFLLTDKQYRIEDDKRLPGGPRIVYMFNSAWLEDAHLSRYEMGAKLVKDETK